MDTRISYVLLLATTVLLSTTAEVGKKLIYYVDFEHTNVTYHNPKYFAVVKYTARRKSRHDPVHYLNLMFESVVPLDKSVKVDVFVYEFLSNQYRRSFVEMHFNMCEIFSKDSIMSVFLKEQLHIKYCPLPVKTYFFKDLSIQDLPLLATFPFQKGRVFINTTNDFGELLCSSYVDATIRIRYV